MFTQPLMIGSTYRVKFKSLFERHGVCTTPGVTCLHKGGGVFRLEQITNFRDVVYGGIKLYDVFFKPLGISELDYRNYFDDKPADEYSPEYTTKTVSNIIGDYEAGADMDGRLTARPIKRIAKHEIHVETGKSILKRHVKDKVNYASYPIYKFVDVIDANDMIWAPELTIADFPEIDIREYRDLSMVIHLGYTHDPAVLDPMLLSIRERMAAFGWRPSLIKMYATATKWMSPEEYDAVKQIKIPATIEVITDDANDIKNDKATMMRKSAIGEMVIEGGALKKIVETEHKDGSVDDPASEISVDAIIRHNVIIDNRLFLTKCVEGDIYEEGDDYYVVEKKKYTIDGVNKEAKCFKKLRETYDYSIGDPCIAYRVADDNEINDRYIKQSEGRLEEDEKLFIRNPGTWTPVPYGHNSDYAEDQLFYRTGNETYVQTSDTTRDLEKTYFIILTDDFNQVTYREANANDFDESGEFPNGSNEGFYELQGEETYTFREPSGIERADPSIVLYVKSPDTYSKVNSIVKDKGFVYYTRAVVLKEVYGTDRSLPLLGFKFDYNDVFNKPKTITLQLEDIIETAAQEMNVVLPDSSVGDDFWGRFMGRKFRWEETPDENDPTVKETFDTFISEETKYLLSEKSGRLLGDSGTIYKEVYIRDTDKQKRNYYMQYVTQQKTLEEQKVRIAELEKALVTLQQSNTDLANERDVLKEENNDLERQIRELTQG